MGSLSTRTIIVPHVSIIDGVLAADLTFMKDFTTYEIAFADKSAADAFNLFPIRIINMSRHRVQGVSAKGPLLEMKKGETLPAFFARCVQRLWADQLA